MRGKSITCFVLMSMLVLCAGCAFTASSSFSYGRPFDENGIAKIVKGKTTTAQLVALFGEPYTKTVVSADEVKWNYYHAEGESTAVANTLGGATVVSDDEMKSLDILLKNEIVVNFSFNKGPIGVKFNAPGVKVISPPK